MSWLRPKKPASGDVMVTGGLAISQSVLKDERWRPDFILSAIQDGVVMVGKDNTIRLLNPAASDIIGWPPKDAMGLDFHSVLALVDQKGEPLPPNTHPFSQALATGQTVRDNNSSLVTRDGKRIPVSIMVSPVTTSTEHGTESVVGIFRDISKEKAEEAARSDFVSTASHEMRTPLAAIEGYLSLALNPKTAKIDDNARHLLEKASMSTKHLSELFSDLLTSSKAEDGRIQSFPTVIEAGEILEQVAEAERFSAQAKGLELRYAVSANSEIGSKVVRPLYYTYVDPNRIREVFQNIINNAIKYTMSGSITVSLTGDSSVAQIQVHDTGTGIPAEDISHLFQKFYRVDNSTTRTVGGTGLGLFICRKIVELYNGRIWVESELGKGSTFFINLPRLSSQQALEIKQKQASTISPLDIHP
ncbi:MAG: sensor histidine kinase [Candidatus Saccharimonadales bacterium]